LTFVSASFKDDNVLPEIKCNYHQGRMQLPPPPHHACAGFKQHNTAPYAHVPTCLPGGNITESIYYMCKVEQELNDQANRGTSQQMRSGRFSIHSPILSGPGELKSWSTNFPLPMPSECEAHQAAPLEFPGQIDGTNQA